MISIDWGNRIIFIPKSDLTLVQTTPTEIYNMDLNWFRLQLKDLEDGEDGMVFPDTHKHNTEVSLGGLTYARVIEIINDYSITFEDGRYAVNLVGANSNVADKVNVNQVSVRSSNSAGLTSAPAIEYSSFNGAITIDVNSPYSGTTFPKGTFQQPVNNLSDALLIAEYRGFNVIHLLSNLIITSGTNIEGYTFKSDDWWLEVHIEDNVSCFNTTFKKLSIFGFMSGIWNVLEDCWVYTITNFAGWLIGGSFINITLSPYNASSLGQSWFDNIVPMYPNENSIIIMNTDTSIACTGLNGNYELRSVTEGSIAVMGFHSGELILDASCVGGDVVAMGIGTMLNNSNGTKVNHIGLMSKNAVVDSINESVGPEIEYSSYNHGVTIDTINGTDSSEFPYGTPLHPCKTAANSYAIRMERGFTNIYLMNNITLSGISDGILDGLSIKGIGGYRTTTTVFDNVLITDCIAENIDATGNFKVGSNATTIDCHIYNAEKIALNAINCTIDSGVYSNTELTNCSITGNILVEENGRFSGVGIIFEGDFTTIDMQGHLCTVSLDIDSGYLLLKNSVSGCLAEFNLRGGELELDSSCTGGDFYIEGYGTLFGDPEALGMHVKANHLLSLETIAQESGGLTSEEHDKLIGLPDTISGSGLSNEERDRLWSIPINTLTTEEHNKLFSISNTISGSGLTLDEHNKLLSLPDESDIGTIITDVINEEIGPTLLRMLGLLQENQYLDQTTYINYNGQKLLSSGRIRTYSNAVSVGTSNNVIATYQITTSWNGDEMQSYKVVKV